jgi:hypothetical protein
MKIKKIVSAKNRIDFEEELDDTIQDLIDLSMDAGGAMENLFNDSPQVSEAEVDKRLETVSRLKNKLLKMYRYKK